MTTQDYHALIAEAVEEGRAVGARELEPWHVFCAAARRPAGALIDELKARRLHPSRIVERLLSFALGIAQYDETSAPTNLEWSDPLVRAWQAGQREAEAEGKPFETPQLVASLLKRPGAILAMFVEREELPVDEMVASLMSSSDEPVADEGTMGELELELDELMLEDDGPDAPAEAPPPPPRTPPYARVAEIGERHGVYLRPYELDEGPLDDPELLAEAVPVVQAAETLALSQRNNVAIIANDSAAAGPVLQALAWRLARERATQAPHSRLAHHAEVLQLTLPQLTQAERRQGGDVGGRLAATLSALREEFGRVVLYLDDPRLLLGDDNPLCGAAATVLEPGLLEGSFQLVVTLTPAEWDALGRPWIELFGAVELQALSEADAVPVLEAARPRLAQHYGVSIGADAARAAVELAAHHLPGQLPANALRLLDRATAGAWQAGATQVGRAEVAASVARDLSLDPQQLAVPFAQRLEELDELLRSRVFGQDQAVAVVSQAIHTAAAGLGESGRPMGSFLLLGGPGVGKTRFAEALAEALYADPAALLRADMSRFDEDTRVDRIFGAAPGFRGFEQRLADAVAARSHAVILLDDIDRAHPSVWEVLVRVMAGEIVRDSDGRPVDFADTTLLMTSSVGGPGERRPLGFTDDHDGVLRGWLGAEGDDDPFEELAPEVREALAAWFRSELLTHVGRILRFRPLGEAQVRAIAESHLAHIQSRLATRGVKLTVAYSAWPLLLSYGHTEQTGAHAMSRVLERLVIGPLADLVLTHRLGRGTEVVLKGEQDELKLWVRN